MTFESVCNVHRLLYNTLRDFSTKEAMTTVYLVINLPWWCMLTFLSPAPCSSGGGRGPLGHNCKIPPHFAQLKMMQHLIFPAMISKS